MMNREEFVKKSLTLGLGLPFLPLLLESCSGEQIDLPQLEINFSGKVLIIGAGAAGLTAGYILQRNNIDFEIIEAAPNYGGRVKRIEQFADFPIDLGAEWIHAEPRVLTDILSDSNVKASIDFITYNPQTLQIWKDGKLKDINWTRNYYSEYKFKNTTWFGFFEKYIVPGFENKISLDSPVSEIDYSGSNVTVKTSNNQTFTGDRVLITVPVKILQTDMITFTPALPSTKTDAISKIEMGDGLKVFIEFKERFYPDILMFDSLVTALTSDDKTYYDAAFRKDSSRNILGLFTIRSRAEEYVKLGSDQAIIEKVLAELDEIFDGKATENYMQHVVQNWSAEPYIQGSYSYNFDGNTTQIMNQLGEPVDSKLYFAGEALSSSNQATVHGASESAYASVSRLLKDT